MLWLKIDAEKVLQHLYIAVSAWSRVPQWVITLITKYDYPVTNISMRQWKGTYPGLVQEKKYRALDALTKILYIWCLADCKIASSIVPFRLVGRQRYYEKESYGTHRATRGKGGRGEGDKEKESRRGKVATAEARPL